MAQLKNGKVSVMEDIDAISEQGFGNREGKALVLAPFEALYLLEKRKIEIFKGKKKLQVQELLRELKKKEKTLEDVYAVFKDLRAAGYIARSGKTENASFRVYARGSRPEEEPARYLLWILDGKKALSFKQLNDMLNRAHATRKKPVFATVNRGNITYFKIDTTKF